MEESVHLTSEEWSVVMHALNRQASREAEIALDLQVPNLITPMLTKLENKILRQLRCEPPEPTKKG
jgi:hypothetical protein